MKDTELGRTVRTGRDQGDHYLVVLLVLFILGGHAAFVRWWHGTGHGEGIKSLFPV